MRALPSRHSLSFSYTADLVSLRPLRLIRRYSIYRRHNPPSSSYSRASRHRLTHDALVTLVVIGIVASTHRYRCGQAFVDDPLIIVERPRTSYEIPGTVQNI